ncbi:FkbM family methyltransferase [bacterium]|nr:FkbM family methyltransferase [bacterium]
MTGATGNIYCGLHEYEDMAFVLHLLRSGDLFVDVGANIGSYTILASAAGAKILAFEPVLSTFESLLDNIYLNRLQELVEARNAAVGSTVDILAMSADQGPTNKVVKRGETYAGETIQVQQVSLDKVLKGNIPKIIKIDVEGYESEVLTGATKTLEDSRLQAVIMELNGSGHSYGYNESELHQYMIDIGFSNCTYEPASRSICKVDVEHSGVGNTLYIRDIMTTQLELSNAPSYHVFGRAI